jgi:hypothetical protein
VCNEGLFWVAFVGYGVPGGLELPEFINMHQVQL